MNKTTAIYTMPEYTAVAKHSDKISAAAKKKLLMGKMNLTRSQRIYLTYHDDLSKKIPRAKIKKHIDFIHSIAPTAKAVGSYRRGQSHSSDIDIVVRESLPGLLKRMAKTGYIVETISSGNKKFSGIVRLPGTKIHRHLDIIFTTPRAYPFAMLYFTGSKKFNIIMRLKAKKKGWKLNEYGLWNGFVSVANIKTERGIFKALDTPYVEPKDR